MTIVARKALGPALALALAGCTNNAGLTNGPPPTSSDKAATRTDLRTPAAPDRGEPSDALHTAGDSDLGGTGTSSGTGARNGGKEGAGATSPNPGKTEGTNQANPPAIVSPAPSSAAGGTKPAGNIEVGTPKGPQ